MLAILEFIFSSFKHYVGFLVILWMICPWLHVRRKVHIFGSTKQKQQQSKQEDKKDQFVVKG